MASIFQYDTGRIELCSLWPERVIRDRSEHVGGQAARQLKPDVETLQDYQITQLEPEPQEGPIEYKLHLLLRPRRSFLATSTVQKVSGSHLSTSRPSGLSLSSGASSGSSTPALSSSSISRQNRLHHLSTQLLWRLQQTCPHRPSSQKDLVVPELPESEISRCLSQGPRELASGLMESLGALYEIGVSDDGSLVGLTQEELDESFRILRAMAFSLGCTLEVLRTVDVGECSWSEPTDAKNEQQSHQRIERLLVAEVLVKPHKSHDQIMQAVPGSQIPPSTSRNGESSLQSTQPRTQERQLRISLTGSTTSGKTSLLGTLSTSTLDNGRGKSRLSLLKHRHEIASGVTSSLAQELIGYQDSPSEDLASAESITNIINYATDHVSSWDDIHYSAHPGRLVFLTDSAGHPRYRRTTVRGLMSWAPDWTLCCVAADEGDDNTGKTGATASASEILGSSAQGVDLSKAHLEFCLRLQLPLVVVITKLDLASRSGIRQICAKVLSVLKEAGRKPVILPSAANHAHPQPPSFPPDDDVYAVKKAIASCHPEDLPRLVPIVLTSAMTGAGISKVHSLLRHLPLMSCEPKAILNQDNHDDAKTLFHVDEVFMLSQSNKIRTLGSTTSSSDCVLSGYLRYGSLEVGQTVMLGPASLSNPSDPSENANMVQARSYPDRPQASPQQSTSRSESKRAHSGTFKPSAERTTPPSRQTVNLWHKVTITSIRYLRLPVRSLTTGQAATVGISFVANQPQESVSEAIDDERAAISSPTPTVRRGMVLLPANDNDNDAREVPPPMACISFAAVFKDSNTYVIPGSSVTVYIASIRASAKILRVEIPGESHGHSIRSRIEDGDVFSFEDDGDTDLASSRSSLDSISLYQDQYYDQQGPSAIEITFQFTSSREWVELGTQVLVTPASGLSMVSPSPNLQHVTADRNVCGSYTPGASNAGNVTMMNGTGANAAGLDGFVGRIVRVDI